MSKIFVERKDVIDKLTDCLCYINEKKVKLKDVKQMVNDAYESIDVLPSITYPVSDCVCDLDDTCSFSRQYEAHRKEVINKVDEEIKIIQLNWNKYSEFKIHELKKVKEFIVGVIK